MFELSRGYRRARSQLLALSQLHALWREGFSTTDRVFYARSLYGLALLLSVGLTALMAMPWVGVLVLLVTFGLGLPLVYAGTVTAYLLTFAPLMWTLGDPLLRRPMWWLTPVLVLAVMLLPGLDARLQLDREAAPLTAGDHGPRSPMTPARTLAVTLPGRDCPAWCADLLRDGQVDWIRVTDARSGGSRRFIWSGQAVTAPDDGAEAGLRLTIAAAPYTGSLKPEELTRVTATDAQGRVLLRRTGGAVLAAAPITVLGPRFTESGSSGPGMFERAGSGGLALLELPRPIGVSLPDALRELGYDP